MSTRKKDWLCSRCGQVSNSSEPCYDCDRKERDANPVPPPPPAPYPPNYLGTRMPLSPKPKRTHWSERQPSCTPFTKGWPRPPAPPAPGLPTRDSSRKSFESEPNWLWQAILSFIDWLIGLGVSEKPKEKTNGEQMLTLDELFEDVEPGIDWGTDEDYTAISIMGEK